MKCRNEWCRNNVWEEINLVYCPKCDDLMNDAMLEMKENAEDKD